jgi:hypothetical protein
VVHGNAVADANGIDFKRGAPSAIDTLPHHLGNSLKMLMPWDDLAEAVYNANKGLRQLICAQAQSAEESPMGSSLNATLYHIASHPLNLAKDKLIYKQYHSCFYMSNKAASAKLGLN